VERIEAMLKKLVEKIKNLNPLVKGFAGFVVVVLMIAAGFWVVDSTKVVPAYVEVLVSPSTATVKIGEEVYENGKREIRPGDYHVEVSLAEFETYTSDITIRAGETYELYVNLEKTEGSLDWYAKNPEEDGLYSSIADKKYEKAAKSFEEKNPVVKILPYHCTKYEANYTVYIEYRIDYRRTEDGEGVVLCYLFTVFLKICACKETDVRESPNVSIFAGGERQGSRGETGYAIFVKNPDSPLLERTV
jgi:hypothetical protein